MQQISIHLAAWNARLPPGGLLGDSAEAALNQQEPTAPLCHLPTMTARRLGMGDRLVVDSVLALLAQHSADALVLCSRHGELERNDRLLHALACQTSVSPTDFTMSVHNAAAGTCTIAAKAPIVSSSISAGIDTFQQAFFEVISLFHAGHQRIILADFEGPIPLFYQQHAGVSEPLAPYAVCLLLTPGTQWTCQPQPITRPNQPATATHNVPQSVQWLQGILSSQADFVTHGERHDWHWTRPC